MADLHSPASLSLSLCSFLLLSSTTSKAINFPKLLELADIQMENLMIMVQLPSNPAKVSPIFFSHLLTFLSSTHESVRKGEIERQNLYTRSFYSSRPFTPETCKNRATCSESGIRRGFHSMNRPSYLFLHSFQPTRIAVVQATSSSRETFPSTYLLSSTLLLSQYHQQQQLFFYFTC